MNFVVMFPTEATERKGWWTEPILKVEVFPKGTVPLSKAKLGGRETSLCFSVATNKKNPLLLLDMNGNRYLSRPC